MPHVGGLAMRDEEVVAPRAVRVLQAARDRINTCAGMELYQLMCQLDLEGIVTKKADSIYDNNTKSRSWIQKSEI